MLTKILESVRDDIARTCIKEFESKEELDKKDLDADIAWRVTTAFGLRSGELITDKRQTKIYEEIRRVKERVYLGLNLKSE